MFKKSRKCGDIYCFGGKSYKIVDFNLKKLFIKHKMMGYYDLVGCATLRR